ncbi:HdeD family acid-resistance protein [Dactylosporangium darangshiense]|uniref:HdeD family acid-resistance protein n=1 Tax=Dactylosporangium darangshiense TaxID=579108 RepID=A0ABP8DL19_9ACTN
MLKREAWLLGIRGVLAIIFGVLAVIWPGVTVIALALLFGIFAIVTGVEQLVHAIRPAPGPSNPVTGFADGTGPRLARGLAGGIGVVLGVLAIMWPGITGIVLAILVGAWAVVTGLSDLWLATRQHGGWSLALIGALAIVAGLFIMVRPAAGALAIAWAIGLYAIISGVLLLVAAYQLTHQGSGRGRMAAAH